MLFYNRPVITLEDLHKYCSDKPNAKLEFPFGEQPAVYKTDGKIFALFDEKQSPLRVNLKCDPGLSEVLREKYETVMPGYHMNKRHWNTIVLTGQLEDQEVYDLINHSYELVTEKN